MKGRPRGRQACWCCVLLRQRSLPSSWLLDKRERPLSDGRRTSPSLPGLGNQNKLSVAALLWPPHSGLTYWRETAAFHQSSCSLRQTNNIGSKMYIKEKGKSQKPCLHKPRLLGLFYGGGPRSVNLKVFESFNCRII